MHTSDRPLGVGFVGCGNVVERHHLPAFLTLPGEFQVRAVADPADGPRERVRELLGLPPERCFASYEPLLDLDDVDVVDVATPPQFRATVVEAAAARGKHVIAEKPLATQMVDVQRMIAARDAHDVTVATTHNHLYLADIAALLDVAASGEIGEIEVLVLSRLGLEDVPGTSDYQPDWRHRLDAGGGVLMDFLHYTYIAEALLGRPIERVAAHLVREQDVERTAVCQWVTDRNVASVQAGWGIGLPSTELRGSEGYAIARAGAVEIGSPAGVRTIPLPEHETALRETFPPIFADFAEAVRGGGRPLATLEDGRHGLEVVLASYKAAAGRDVVEVPLTPEDPVFAQGIAAIEQSVLP